MSLYRLYDNEQEIYLNLDVNDNNIDTTTVTNLREIKDDFNPNNTFGLSGLVNIGNTCYMNATLQCLLKTVCFKDFMIDQESYENIFHNFLIENINNFLVKKIIKEKNLNEDVESVDIELEEYNKLIHSSITYNIHKLFKQMWFENCVITPQSFKKAISLVPHSIFKGYQQQDSQEILSFILDKIHEECKTTEINIEYKNIPKSVVKLIELKNKITKKVKKTSNNEKKQKYLLLYNKYIQDHYDDFIIYKSITQWTKYMEINGCSIMTDLFCGQYITNILCNKCKNKSSTFDNFLGVINLPIPSNSDVSLDDCLMEFIKDETLDGTNKYFCDKCKIQTDAIKNMKLFKLPPIIIIQLKRYKTIGNHQIKNNTNVIFPIDNLSFDKYMSNYIKDNSVYKLYAITQQIGSLNGGHYIAFGLNPINNKWYKYDDSNTTYIPDDCIKQELYTNKSYILYYQKEIIYQEQDDISLQEFD
jgi:ubiquitin C-terminal hydrolase